MCESIKGMLGKVNANFTSQLAAHPFVNIIIVAFANEGDNYGVICNAVDDAVFTDIDPRVLRIAFERLRVVRFGILPERQNLQNDLPELFGW